MSSSDRHISNDIKTNKKSIFSKKETCSYSTNSAAATGDTKCKYFNGLIRKKCNNLSLNEFKKSGPVTGANSAGSINSSMPDESSSIDISKVFKQYDIKETSLHLQISLLNIHMYTDDNYSGIFLNTKFNLFKNCYYN